MLYAAPNVQYPVSSIKYGPGQKNNPVFRPGYFAAPWTPLGGGIGYPRDQPCQNIISEWETLVKYFVIHILHFVPFRPSSGAPIIRPLSRPGRRPACLGLDNGIRMGGPKRGRDHGGRMYNARERGVTVPKREQGPLWADNFGIVKCKA